MREERDRGELGVPQWCRVEYSDCNRRMKTLRRQRKHHPKPTQQPRTVRDLQSQNQKQQFFEKVAVALHEQFPPDHLQLFLQHLANSLPHPPPARPHPPDLPLPHSDDNPLLRRLDPSLFADPPLPPFPPFSKQVLASDDKPHTSTPKQMRPSACLFTRKLFEVDLRMRRHYERAKQRLSPLEDSGRPKAVRISLAGGSSLGRCSTTQRTVRYKTEQQDTAGEGVPAWLLAPSISTRHTTSGLRRNTFEQRRMECLGRRGAAH